MQTLDDVLKSLPPARRRKSAARAKELLAEEASLQDLRKAMGLTQVKMAKALGVGQDAISRVEQRTDMLLSTLGDYVKGMGGELSLIAEFPDRPPVRLSVLEPLARTPARVRRKPNKAHVSTRKRRKSA